MKIGEKTFVSLIYTLKVGGEVVDSTTKENPLSFICGAGYMLPKFEEHITGLAKGEKFKFTLTPEDGYGPTMEEAVVELPRTVFMVDGTVEEGLLVVGNHIPMSTADGQQMVGVVKEVSGDNVKMDFNHAMSGKTLDFSGEILDVREATDDDYAQAMGGCGCDCGECADDKDGGECGCGSCN